MPTSPCFSVLSLILSSRFFLVPASYTCYGSPTDIFSRTWGYTHTCRRHTPTGSETQYMHALSQQASQVADIFHFCAYKVIIIILVGVTEQGSIHCNCQPPINIPLLLGNPRSSRDLQFTQLRSMWTKPSILSFPLFPPSPFPYPSSSFSYHFTTWSATVCLWHFSVFLLCLFLSALTCLPPPHPPWFPAPISLSCVSVTSHLSSHT